MNRQSHALLWLAPWQNPSGYCSEALAFARGLAGSVPLQAVDLARTKSPAFVEGLPDGTRHLLRSILVPEADFAGKFIVQHLPGSGFAPIPKAAYCIGRTMFETDRLPAEWVRKCNLLDEIWVPSRFNLETFAASGVHPDKLVVVPGAVDETLFAPGLCQPLPLPRRAACNFLSVFEWSTRKGWDVLLAAYLREFSAEDDVCLYLRVYLTNQPDTDARTAVTERVRQFAGTLGLGAKPLPRFEILSEQIPTRELPGLYRAVDCLVAPSRGEGWGRPHHEAMMMGVPVIAPHWSGNTEFMNPDNSYPLEYELAEVAGVEPEFALYRGHRWALASERHLRQLLRRVQQNPAEARERGAKAREHVLRHFSLQPVAGIVRGRLETLELRLSTPACPAAVARILPVPIAACSQPVHVAWEGAFLDFGSLAHVNRQLTAQLARLPQLKISCIGTTAPQRPLPAALQPTARSLAARPPADAQVLVRHAWPPDWSASVKPLVLMQPWEFGALPEQWVRQAEQVLRLG